MRIIKNILIFALSTMIIIGGAWYMTKDPKVDPTLNSLLNIKSIKESTDDILNETGVTSEDDIKFKVEDKTIMIHYGKHKFRIRREDVNDPEILAKLNKLGLSIKVNNNGIYLIKYNGERIKELA